MYSFENLKVWKKARLLVVNLYKLTKTFPKDEKFGLTSQIRRASVSVCSNIAEGSTRWSRKDQARFYEIAYGSLIEMLNQLIISVDLGLTKSSEMEKLRINIDEIAMMLNALRKSSLK